MTALVIIIQARALVIIIQAMAFKGQKYFQSQLLVYQVWAKIKHKEIPILNILICFGMGDNICG